MVELGKLGELRNQIAHSKYSTWINLSGDVGLIRENSKLRAKEGIRETIEEELLPESFDTYIEQLESKLRAIESYRHENH